MFMVRPSGSACWNPSSRASTATRALGRLPFSIRLSLTPSPDQVVGQKAECLLEPFLDASRDLVESGVDGITANCGFLTLFLSELFAATVPIASSSLMQVPGMSNPTARQAGRHCYHLGHNANVRPP